MNTETTTLPIRGMICRACTEAVETALTQTRGVVSAQVHYYKSEAEISYDPALVSADGLAEAVRRAGYDVGKKGAGERLFDLVCLLLAAGLVWFFLRSPLNPVPEATAETPLGVLFVIGLLTSTHCVGMCGGILLGTTTSADLSRSRSAPLLAALAYNGGRLVSYTAMGAVFGAAGAVITYTMQTKSMVFTLVGLLVAALGLNMWGLIPGLRALAPQQNGACSLPQRARRRYAGRPWLVGLLTGLMPCGALYAMWLAAMASGSAVQGAVKMLAFTAGTAPLLIAFGALGAWFPRRWNKYLLKASCVLMTAMGVKMLLTGLRLSGWFG